MTERIDSPTAEYDGKRHSEAREGVFGLKTEYDSVSSFSAAVQ